jgi:multisubunit Na+/H+ antiporter MnhG subunit
MSSLKEALKTIGIIVAVIAIIIATGELIFLSFWIILFIALCTPFILLGMALYAIYRYIREKRRRGREGKSVHERREF